MCILSISCPSLNIYIPPSTQTHRSPAQVRKICELTLAYARQHLRALGQAPLAEQVTSPSP